MHVAAQHAMSVAQLLLAWQWQQGIVMNPRSMRPSHMQENLHDKVFTTKLSAGATAIVQGFKPDRCSHNNTWYECCGDPSVQPSIPQC